ncbi:protein-methionine sulfoxide oxidase mical3a isoform X17 [Alosa alosa]|uniref:protein-methionine sulfoxide oxidase mical3a isoform X17 n=1 Tax=Alosa alosa TaxID=278164 RepID=UPI00201515D4|nr:protein-methionine sulfoxide oxidase mical3a isoform X17 [Alosa alosa]
MADRGGGPGVGVGGVGGGVQVNLSHVLFDRFVQASTCKGTLKAFQELCDHVQLKPTESRIFYHKLKSKLNYWKAKALWAKLDKRASQKDYKKGRACANSRCVIIGAGPCGLRTAIELAFLGAKVVLLEKRDAFSRNNVLHLWPYTIQDLRGLGAKKFYGKFCAGSIDHISIRQLQLMLLKVALLLGIEIHVNVEFKGLIEPPEDQENERIGWRAEVHPRTHPVNELEFDVIIGADGRRNTLAGFRRKEFRGKLAIAITANFINRNTTAEASVEEISGVAFIFNQKFFQDLREATGIDLENIVYYKDDTHYFVMTAKKQSLLEKGVILHDYADTEMLLSRANVDQAALLSYAREAADFSTNQRLPALDFAINHYGQPDVAMFDFTCMYASENAALVRQRHGHQLLVALVGDSLLEPFWPMGTGIARGFLAAMDSAWMVRSWAQGKTPLEVLAERESIYRLLPQTTPENVSKNFSQYSVDPTTRYPNISLHLMRPNQVRHLIDTGESKETLRIDMENVVNASTPKLSRNELRLFEQQLQESVARSSKLLNWCQRQTEGYRAVAVTDLTTSWKSGMALCALIHRYRPDLIDFDSLDERDVAKNNQLAFDVAEREFGISPIMTGKEMSVVAEPDKLSMVMYLSQFYEMFKDTLPPSDNHSPEERATAISNTQKSHPISFLKLHLGFNSRKRTPKDKKDEDSLSKKLKTGQSEEDDLQRGYHDDRSSASTAPSERKVDAASAAANYNKIKSIQTQLQAKFVDTASNPAPPSGLRRQGSLRKEFPQNIGGSDVCYFCQRRVYVMERLSAEGKFFHRSCFSCDYCGTTLRLSSYAFDVEKGKFYCKPHYCYRASGQGQKKRPAPASVSTKEAQATDPVTVDSSGRPPSALAPAERRPSVPEMNGVGEPSMAKRLRGTPERIELENYRLSLQREEELEEVPEETLAEHNLSSVLDKATDVEEGSSSSESDMEDEDEEEEERQPGPSDLGGVPWKEAVEIHAKLKGDSDAEAEGTRNGLGPRIHVQEDGEMEDDMEGGEEEDEEEEEEEEDDEDDESSDEGEYCPWERELQSGLWLESLADEEDICTFKARNLRLQQALQPVDPLAVPQELCRTPTPLEGGQEGPSTSSLPSQPTAPSHTSARHEAVRAWLDSLSGETCGEEEDPEAEAGSLNIEPGTERDYDDIPSDAEAEARLHQTPDQEEMPEEPGRPESLGRVSSLGQTSESPKQLVVDVVLSPIPKAPQPELGEVHAHGKSPPVPVFVMSPGARFFPEVFRTDAAELPTPSQSPQLQPQSPVFSALFAPVTSPAAVTTPVEASPTDSVSPVVAYLATVSPEVISPGPVSPVVAYLATVSPEVISPGPVSPVVVSPAVASPAAISPAPLPASATSPTSPIRSQPLPLPETPSPKPPTTQPQSCACTPSANPLSPICAQTLPCQDPSSPLSSSSPVRTQPFPAATSTPASKPTPQAASTTPLTPPIGETDDSMEVTPAKKDIIEEFWQKSAEIRKSLGLTPLNRTRSVEQRSSVLVTNETTPAPSPGLDTTSFSSSSAVSPPTPKPRTPEVPQALEDLRPSFPNGGGRSVIRRLNITLEGQLISPAETKNSRSPSERREPSSSSGLGLNGSGTATSDSASVSCASDSTLLTPPSSPPPPPPPDEEPATLKHKVTWDGLPLGETDATGLEKTRGQLDARTSSPPPPPPPPVSCSTPRDRSSSVPTAAAAANTTTTPIPAPRTGPVGSCVVMRRDVKPRREQARKSFAESVEEIPFADDVEDTYDDRTPETSANERFFTPPTSKKDSSSSRPPLHLALAMENGKPNIPSNLAGSRPSPTVKTPTHISPEAKEIAEERMRAREKSVKSQVLKDAMAKQLSKMKEPEAVKDAMTKQLTKMKESDTVKGAVAKVAWTVSETTGKHKKKRSSSPKMTAVESLESKKQAETLPERFFTTPSGRSQESSVASSESSAGSKSKKRSSLFSPRKNKKEKKSKGEGRGSGSEDTPPKHKSLWKAVFSGYKKDKKKKEDKSCPSTPSSSSTTTDSGKKKGPALERSAADLKLRKNLSFSEDSDISCDDILERSSQKSKADHHMDIFDLVSDLKKDAMKEKEEREKEKERLRENERMKDRKRAKERENVRVKQKGRDRDIIPELERGNEDESVYVPHALAFKRSYATKKTYTEEELNAKLTRRVQKAARRQAKQEELKRLHRAQIIQRQLEQVEEKQRQLEERGVAVEKALRGEAGVYKSSNVYPKQHKRRSDYWGDSNYSEILDLHLGGMGKKDDPKLMQEWFKLVQEKNALVRYESELMIFARELELEDRQSRLQQELRERMAVDDHMKAEEELAEEKRILNEMLEVVEQRDSLVALLEEQRLQEKEEDKDLESVMLSKGFNLNWA